MRKLFAQLTIPREREDIWDLLADFGNVAYWAPGMRLSKLTTEQESGPGTRRWLRHAWGFQFEEVVTAWSDGHGFEFDVVRAPYPMKDVHERWRIDTNGSSAVVATEVTYQMRLGFLGRILDQLIVRHLVYREMKSGLQGLKHTLSRTAQTE